MAWFAALPAGARSRSIRRLHQKSGARQWRRQCSWTFRGIRTWPPERRSGWRGLHERGRGRALDRLSFRRITDIPFETYWAVLEKWQCIEHGGELRIGRSLLRGPIEHDRDSGTYRIKVRLGRGPLRPLLCMRLNIDRWSWLPARTALELIPCERVWPTAAYFRAGHLLLDSLTRSVQQHMPTQHFDYVQGSSFAPN